MSIQQQTAPQQQRTPLIDPAEEEEPAEEKPVTPAFSLKGEACLMLQRATGSNLGTVYISKCLKET